MSDPARRCLEAALLDDFDDVATHAAYADRLIETGDPRGEFIHLSLALEDHNQPARELERMRERASALRFQYEREWLGPLAPFLLPPRRAGSVDPVEPNCTFGWVRGWVGQLSIFHLTPALTEAVADAAELRMLRELNIAWTRDARQANDLLRWAVSPYFANLRSFSLGDPDSTACTADGRYAAVLVQKSSRHLRRLRLRADRLDIEMIFRIAMPQLRELHVEFAHEYPIAHLAANHSLANVTRIALDPRSEDYRPDPATHVPDMPTPAGAAEVATFCRAPHWRNLTDLRARLTGTGDVFAQELVRSGLLGRLRTLDLCRSGLTDDGARIIAEFPAAARLKQLDVQGNQLTPFGVELLQSLDIKVHANYQVGDYAGGGADDGLPFGLGTGNDIVVEDI